MSSREKMWPPMQYDTLAGGVVVVMMVVVVVMMMMMGAEGTCWCQLMIKGCLRFCI